MYYPVPLGAVNSTLARGAKGPEVAELQNKIISFFKAKSITAMPQYGADADFGGETETWLKKYQEAKGIKVTGIADLDTRIAMGFATAPSASSGTSTVAKSIAKAKQTLTSPSSGSGIPMPAIVGGVGALLLLVGMVVMKKKKSPMGSNPRRRKYKRKTRR